MFFLFSPRGIAVLISVQISPRININLLSEIHRLTSLSESGWCTESHRVEWKWLWWGQTTSRVLIHATPSPSQRMDTARGSCSAELKCDCMVISLPVPIGMFHNSSIYSSSWEMLHAQQTQNNILSVRLLSVILNRLKASIHAQTHTRTAGSMQVLVNLTNVADICLHAFFKIIILCTLAYLKAVCRLSCRHAHSLYQMLSAARCVSLSVCSCLCLVLTVLPTPQ